MTHSSWLVTFPLLALGCAAPALELDAEPEDGQIQLDETARGAGWELRVGGFCLPLDGETPVDVPKEEWALIGRWDGEAYDFQYLYPPSGALMWVHGSDARIEVIEETQSDAVEVDEPEAATGRARALADR